MFPTPLRRPALFAAASLVALVVLSARLTADPSDPFDLANQAKAAATDPFAPENRAKTDAPPAVAKKRSARDLETEEIAKRIRFHAAISPAEAKPGEVVRLTVTGTPAKGWHTYPLTKRSSEQSSGQLSRITFSGDSSLKPLWPVTETAPEFAMDGGGNVLLEHDKEFSWSQEVVVLPDATPGRKTLGVQIHLMVCDEKQCWGPGDYPPLEAVVTVAGGEGVALSPVLAKRLGEPRPKVAEVEVPAAVRAELAKKRPAPGSTAAARASGPKAAPGTAGARQEASPGDLLGLLGAAFGGAFLMLLTPCVFPMIPITVNFFLKQSEREHHRPLAVATVYSGTIIVLLTVVMLILGKVVIDLANNAWFNLALGLVLIFFALSLFGMYEIELPSALARFTSAREGQGGYLGAMFMALTFTITSFTCTGPFLGVMLAPVAGLQPPFLHLVLAALVYSATFAAPFFLLALFPAMLKKLPKSGGWLNAVKVTMGFLELGAALKFLSNTDMAWNPGNPRLFNYDTVLSAWIALSVAAGLYLFGAFRLPHDDKVENIGVVRMIFASIFIGLAVYLTPALQGGRPSGVVGENIIAFLPPNLKKLPGGGAGPGAEAGAHLAWHLDYQDAWEEARREKKLIFIDFTGVNCTNCRDNEENVFPQPRVNGLLRKYVRVQLYTDSVPNPRLSASEANEQAARNKEWQAAFGNLTNPFYVIFEPDRERPLTSDGLLNGKVVATVGGKIFNLDQFVVFLQEPQDRIALSARSWHLDYIDAWTEARKEKKPILIEFTGQYSVAGIQNRQDFLPSPEVKKELARYVRAELFTDVVPSDQLSPEEQRRQGVRNLEWLRALGTETCPTYVVFRPDWDQPFEAGRLKGSPLGTTGGRIDDPAAFAHFLREPRDYLALGGQ